MGIETSSRPSAPDANPLVSDLDHVLASTRGLWEQLRGKSIFVTGGTGFIGKWLLESFVRASDVLDLQARMTVLTRDIGTFTDEHPRLARHPAIRYIEGDVRDFTWPKETYYAVIHGAAQASAELNREYPLLMTRTITEGTHNVLEMAKDRGVRRFLFISSGAVYGEQPADMAHTPEQYRGAPDSLDPGSAYAESKRMGEAALFHLLRPLRHRDDCRPVFRVRRSLPRPGYTLCHRELHPGRPQWRSHYSKRGWNTASLLSLHVRPCDMAMGPSLVGEGRPGI